ncbi:hypothetical protein [Photobacterium damselae]|uniref:hypothetical protein n=1 Tax=Photobacterium damselae TaxID=38293 RepID=UPI00406984D2
MLYMLKTACNEGDGIADIETAANKVKERGGCLVLSDFSNFRAVPSFLKICREKQCNHAVGLELELWDGQKRSGKVTLMATSDQGILSLSRILFKANLLPENIANTKYGKSQFSLGKNTAGKVVDVNDLVNNKDGVLVVYMDGSPAPMFGETEHSEVHDRLVKEFGGMLIGGLKSLGDESDLFDDELYRVMQRRVVSTTTVKMDDMTEYEQVRATSHSRGCGKSTTFEKSETIEYPHYYYNQVVKDNTDSLCRMMERNSLSVDPNGEPIYGTILKPERVPDIVKNITFKEDSYKKLEEYLAYKNKLDERDAYTSYLDREISLVEKLGFDSYFETVVLAMRHYSNIGVSCRVRGSAASSMCLFLLGDWDRMVDPISAGLDLDRFLSERTTKMMDVDLDVSHRYRAEFYKFAEELLDGGTNDKYRVAALTVESKVRRLSKAINFAFLGYREILDTDESSHISEQEFDVEYKRLREQFHPSDWKKSIDDIKANSVLNARLMSYINSAEPKFKQLYNLALDLNGLNTEVAAHSSGVVICDKGKWFDMPLMPMRDGRMAVQLDGAEDAPNCGLVKFDVLTSRNITLLDSAERHVRNKLGYQQRLDLMNVSKDAIEFLVANPAFINQFSGSAVRYHTSYVNPQDIDGLITAMAIRNPAILDEDREKYKRNKARGVVDLPMGIKDPIIEEIFAPTWGIFMLDEQILEIGKRFSGLNSLNASDLLTGVRKNKPKLLASVKDAFIDGAVANGKSKELAENVFKFVESIRGKYSFCKAHAYSYLFVALEQSEIKRNHPAEFLQGVMDAYCDDASNVKKFEKVERDRLGELIAEYQKLGIRFNPPSITNSNVDCCKLDFGADNPTIYFSLSQAIPKTNVGEKMVALLKELQDSGELSNLDLMQLIDMAYVRTTGLIPSDLSASTDVIEDMSSQFIDMIESMVVVGCFDDIPFDGSDAEDSSYYLDADRKGIRELHLGRVTEYVNSLAFYEVYDSVSEVEFELNDLYENDKSVFGVVLSRDLEPPQIRNISTPTQPMPKCA